MSNEIQGDLSKYKPNNSKRWDATRVKHLYNRIGSGCNLTELKVALTMNPDQLVDQLIDDALTVPIPEYDVFPWAQHPVLIENDPYEFFDYCLRMRDVTVHLATNLVLNPVKYKMVLFWSNHFVTENDPNLVHSATSTYLYFRELCKYALGNFQRFTEKISLTPMMLMYLNGNSNTAEKPNENFARELLELFTIGDGNYEQEDIVNIARGYTGWKAGSHGGYLAINQFVFGPDEYILLREHHDWTTIELFGKPFTPKQPSNDEEAKQFALEEFEWIVETIFTEKKEEVAKFICGKLYKFYVYEEINEGIVAAMAEIFQQDWNIAEVLRVLFKSEHFFDHNAIGVQIKSSTEMYVQYMKKMGYEFNVHWYNHGNALHPDYIPNIPFDNEGACNESGFQTNHNNASWMAFQGVGQALLNPPNVAGYKGGRHWLTETNLLGRWNTFLPFILRLLGFNGWSNEDLMDRPLNQQYIVDHLIELTNDSKKVEDVVKAIIEFHFSCPLSEETIQAAVVAFKQNYHPEHYYEDGTWFLGFGREWQQFGYLMIFLARQPEFQLT